MEVQAHCGERDTPTQHTVKLGTAAQLLSPYRPHLMVLIVIIGSMYLYLRLARAEYPSIVGDLLQSSPPPPTRAIMGLRISAAAGELQV